MSPSRTMGSLLGRPGLFYRSVALERDALDPSASRGYVLTPWLDRRVTEILSGMRADATRRAWRIIGDFGVGKSALALALVQALDPRLAHPAMPVRRLADGIGGMPRMFPLLVTGSRDGLTAGLSVAVREAASVAGLLDLRRAKAILAAADPFAAIVKLRDALRATGAFDGVLLVVDEMGKFLEAAGEAEGFDVFRLQSLAEAAARSGDAPIGVLLILHKGFQSYAEDWRTARRSEWEKVAERFEEVVFDHPLSHTAALLAAALAVDQDAIPAKARKASDEAVKRVRAVGWLGPRNVEGAGGCWPIHPASTAVMARFFATFGQNERSLFGFAASEEPYGLRAFAAETPMGSGLYGIHHFFDYVAASFGHRLTSRAGTGEWGRIAAVLERAADADPTETAVLKAVGLLNLLDAPDMAPTLDGVQAALVPAFAAEEIGRAAGRLVDGGLLFRRPGRADLRLWTSHRVDLSTVWSEAEREVDGHAILCDLPRHVIGLPIRSHLLARRHSVVTGTNRRFVVRCTHASALNGQAERGDADGSIAAVFCGTGEDMRIARAWAAEVTGELETRLAVVVPPMPEVGRAMVDLLRHRWVIANASALREDAFAAAEVERTVADLEAGLVADVEAALGLKGRAPSHGVEVYWRGQREERALPMHAMVSRLCDRIFVDAPKVDNELVNRHALTSAGAKGRQQLIERMFAHGHDPELGFGPKKNPPERALFLSLLRRGRVHRAEDGAWVIAPPPVDDDPLNLRPALDAIERRLAGDGGRVPLPEIYEVIESKPYGVRRGLGPVLLAVELVAAGHRVALFERGTYCARLDGAAFMRILKAPEHFALQWVSLEGVRADVFRRLAALFDRPSKDSGIRAVVDPLIRFGVDLPFHVQHSSGLGPEARAVRKALAEARSPIDLVFVDLPKACGCEPFSIGSRADAARVTGFVTRLDAAIAELRGCYPQLLERMRLAVLGAFGAADRHAIAERAAPLAFRVREQQLRTFAMRLADAALGEDAWTEALGGATVGKPPARWLDHDVEEWRSRLAELAGRFRRVEAAAFGEGDGKRSAVRVSLTRVDGEERSVVVDLAGLSEDQVVAIGAIERMAGEAGLSLDEVAALLSIEGMRQEDGRAVPAAQVGKGRE